MDNQANCNWGSIVGILINSGVDHYKKTPERLANVRDNMKRFRDRHPEYVDDCRDKARKHYLAVKDGPEFKRKRSLWSSKAMWY